MTGSRSTFAMRASSSAEAIVASGDTSSTFCIGTMTSRALIPRKSTTLRIMDRSFALALRSDMLQFFARDKDPAARYLALTEQEVPQHAAQLKERPENE